MGQLRRCRPQTRPPPLCGPDRGQDPHDEQLQVRAFAVENTSFPGYVSEKIFDCFSAGCVPVYLGAPDIEKYVPANCFIDMRRFKGYRELDDHLRSITAPEAEAYRSAARAFLTSPLYEPFDNAFVARSLATALLESVTWISSGG